MRSHEQINHFAQNISIGIENRGKKSQRIPRD